MSTTNIFLKSIYIEPQCFIEIIRNVAQKQFSNKKRNGFLIEEKADNSLSGYFIRELPTEMKVFSSDKNRIIKQVFYKSVLVYFEIHRDENLLEISSTNSDAAAFLAEISRLSKFKILISDFQIPFDKVVDILRRDRFSFYIQKVKVRDYPIWEGVIAECSFTLTNQSEWEKLFSKCSEKIESLTIFFDEIGREGVKVSFHKEGIIILPRGISELEREKILEIKNKIIRGIINAGRTECCW